MNERESPKNSKLEQNDVQEFIQDRNIQPEHFSIIVYLLEVPKNIIIERFHNYFNSLHERSAGQLRRDITYEESDELRKIYQAFLEIVEAYDSTVAYNLVRVLERASP